jgi:hypothetical protein
VTVCKESMQLVASHLKSQQYWLHTFCASSKLARALPDAEECSVLKDTQFRYVRAPAQSQGRKASCRRVFTSSSKACTNVHCPAIGGKKERADEEKRVYELTQE